MIVRYGPACGAWETRDFSFTLHEGLMMFLATVMKRAGEASGVASGGALNCPCPPRHDGESRCSSSPLTVRATGSQLQNHKRNDTMHLIGFRFLDFHGSLLCADV